MTYVDSEDSCTRCGRDIMVEFNSRTGSYSRITGCYCDKVEKRLRKQIRDLKKQLKEAGKNGKKKAKL